MNLKYVIIFALGAASGIGGSSFFFKTKYEKRADEEIKSVKDRYEEYKNKLREDVGEINERLYKAYEHEDKPEKPVDPYTNVVEKAYRDSSSYEFPSEEAGSEDSEDEEDLDEGRFESERMNNIKSGPKLIRMEDYSEEPQNDKIELHFYAGDGILTTDDDEEIIDQEEVVGDCLTKFGFNVNDEPVIFVRNMRLGADYEITKVNSCYADTVDV